MKFGSFQPLSSQTPKEKPKKKPKGKSWAGLLNTGPKYAGRHRNDEEERRDGLNATPVDSLGGFQLVMGVPLKIAGWFISWKIPI